MQVIGGALYCAIAISVSIAIIEQLKLESGEIALVLFLSLLFWPIMIVGSLTILFFYFILRHFLHFIIWGFTYGNKHTKTKKT